MPKLLSEKAGRLSVGDALMIAITKTFTERFLAGYIGNATVMSGGIKIGGAFALNKLVGGKIGDILGTALMVDGTEDIANALLGGGAIPLLRGGVQSGGDVVTI